MTPQQIQDGALDLPEVEMKEVQQLLTFDEAPSAEECVIRANKIADIAEKHSNQTVIGGAPFFMHTLETVLRERGITPLFAFSKRQSIEETNTDGTVNKKTIFVHEKFFEV